MTKGKVLVTGAPGWLGNRFVKILRDQGRDVRCLVLKGMDTSHLEKLGAELFEGDITKPETLKDASKGVETVFHIAGLVHVPLTKAGLFDKVNYEGTKNLLDESIKNGAKRFIYISSNSAAGTNESREKLMDEKTKRRPYMKYGRSKVKAEDTVNDASKKGKIETVILRPCWYYGPGQPKRQTKLMHMVNDGKALLFGDGKNLRSMTYIDNLCDAMILAEKTENANGEIYWIADERPYTTIEIYKAIADLLGVELKTRNIPGVAADFAKLSDSILQKFGLYQKEIHVAGEMNKNIACSIEKAKKELGYKPKIGLEEGMRISIEWAKENGQL